MLDRDLPTLVNFALLNGGTPDPALLRKYQSMCGALLYASGNTRPDIAFATGMLCRAMGRPTPGAIEGILHRGVFGTSTRRTAVRNATGFR